MNPIATTVNAKVTKKLVPFLMLLFFIAFVDRVNVSVASLTMNADLGFSQAVYGLGAGLFFIGYFLFEMPSNFILERVGARKWIARIMITWGIVSVAMMFVKNEPVFYSLRFLLGVAEAGFYPGILYYITSWFPMSSRTRAFSFFQMAAPISLAIGSPLAGAILKMNGVADLHGWQWVFLLTGLPAIILGFVTIKYLTDTPEQAKWLNQEEKEWLINEIKMEKSSISGKGNFKFSSALKIPQFWILNLAYFFLITGFYGVTFFLPQVVKTIAGDASNFTISLFTAIPWLAAVVALYYVSKHSQKTGERKYHAALPFLIGSIGLFISTYMDSPVSALLFLAIAAAGIQSGIPSFWTIPSGMFTGAAAAGAIAMINSIGNLGGFVGPYIVGFITDNTGNVQNGIMLMSIFLFIASICVLTLKVNVPVSDRK